MTSFLSAVRANAILKSKSAPLICQITGSTQKSLVRQLFLVTISKVSGKVHKSTTTEGAFIIQIPLKCGDQFFWNVGEGKKSQAEILKRDQFLRTVRSHHFRNYYISYPNSFRYL